MSNCRYDRETKAHVLEDGEPCRVDDYGDPTTHCRARSGCNQHVGAAEITCARCIGRVRQDIRQVVSCSALMLPAAIAEGVNSEPAMLAAPGADPSVLVWRRILAKRWIQNHIPAAKWEAAIAGLIEDDDDRNPYNVLTRWQVMLSEDWGHALPEHLTITAAGAYLERQLGRLAQDPEQDFPLFAREVRKVRSHLETVLHNDTRAERGAPCPECKTDGKFVRMARHYSHWCEDAECARFHFDDDSADVWACPANTEHWFTAAAYANYLEDRGA